MSIENQPESNVELVQEAYRTFGNNEWDAFFSLFEDDFHWVVSDGFPYGGHYRGREEVMTEVFSQIQAEWESFNLEIDRFIDGGDSVVVVGQYEGIHGTTGEDVIAPFSHIIDIGAEKIRRFQRFTDTVQFQAAIP